MLREKLANDNRGVALLLTVLTTIIILFLAIYYLSFTLTENKISKSQIYGVKTYYLAEAGIADMIWKLKNDESYKTSFETNPAWSENFTRTNPFGSGTGSYTVSIANSNLARGEITSTGIFDAGGGKISQRIIKTQVYKAMGTSGIGSNPGYADGNIDINGSLVDFHNGSAHSNGNFIVNGASTVDIDADLEAVGNFNKVWFSTVNVAGATHAANYPPAAAPIPMPAIDFDSADSNSYKNKATVVYTETQFANLIKNNRDLNLPGPITYVSGNVNVRGDENLTINGLLVVERDFVIGQYWCLGFRCGNSSVTVNHAEGTASGILAKRKINFQSFTDSVNINGLVYANDSFDISSVPLFGGTSFNITGAAVGRKLSIFSCWQDINITFNNEYVTEALGGGLFSPVITVEHWEEEY